MKWLRSPGYRVAVDSSNDADDHLAQPVDPVSTQAQNMNKRVKRLSVSREVHHKQSSGRLFRRLVGLCAALWFVYICSSSCIGIRNVLVGTNLVPTNTVLYETLLMRQYIGTTTVRHSPLVIQVLQNDTTPRNSTIFLRTEAETSPIDCGFPTIVQGMYSNDFHQHFFSQLKMDTQHNLTFLQHYELVAPVIDCSYSGLVYGDSTALRLFYIMRSLVDAEDVRLFTLILQTSEYELMDHSNVFGSTLLTTATFLDNLSATEVHHYLLHAIGYPYVALSFHAYEFLGTTPDFHWIGVSIPNSTTEIARTVKSTSRQGTYINNESDRCSSMNNLWVLHQTPLEVISKLQFISVPVLRNSWAWVHLIHLFLVVEMVFNLVLLGTISSNHGRQYGRIWLGDAFMVLNSRLWMLLLVVLVSWCVEGFWSLIEICIHDGNAITKTQGVFIYESIMRADLMILCFGLADIMGKLSRERIEPALALVVFYGIFELGLSILQWNSALLAILTTFTNEDYNLAIIDDPAVSLITPMRLWNVHVLEPVPANAIAAALTPIFGSYIVCMAVYILMHKLSRNILRRFKRDAIAFSSTGTQARVLTLFEESTGTKLFGRAGFVSHYENTFEAQGIHFATGDGIYSNGFVIANDKFVVQTSSLLVIWAIKIANTRFTDVYVYDLIDGEIQPCSRLVYPSTLTIRDLMHINVHKLM